MTAPDPVAAYLAQARARFSNTNYAITTESPRMISVAVASTSDVPRLLAVAEAVLALAADWLEDARVVPYIDRAVAASALRAVIAAELLGKEDADDPHH
jgi:hypothetical protein